MASGDLTAKQRAAIAALLTGASYADAAQAAGVHENTVCQWVKLPAFTEALRAAESERLQAVTRALIAIADKATDTLEGVLDNDKACDSSRIRAANVVLGRLLQIKKLADLEERVRKLEEANNGKSG